MTVEHTERRLFISYGYNGYNGKIYKQNEKLISSYGNNGNNGKIIKAYKRNKKINIDVRIKRKSFIFAVYLESYRMTDNDITYKIRGAIYEVYKTLGPGLLESIYEEALRHELELQGLTVSEQEEIPVIYKGKQLKCQLRYDLLVNDRIIVEIKSVEEMKRLFYRQTMTYLRLLHLHTGILVNFNTENILTSTKRIYNSKD